MFPGISRHADQCSQLRARYAWKEVAPRQAPEPELVERLADQLLRHEEPCAERFCLLLLGAPATGPSPAGERIGQRIDAGAVSEREVTELMAGCEALPCEWVVGIDQYRSLGSEVRARKARHRLERKQQISISDYPKHVDPLFRNDAEVLLEVRGPQSGKLMRLLPAHVSLSCPGSDARTSRT